ncbi:unnamed protein product [Rhizophagus irregularis]|uniref:Ribosome-assembly protein 3 C-terminal domain-containing protein n=5 Tax=Rhizophagus irregularis TaxID=588596 RepID=A0A915ZA92_9GLOM|nr:hypothetical protein GLOIN_2v1837046 [Rhizophagus irregularis DAOM 181602=DAOM 197198]EXX56102.1 hypothetical protein RirG_219390 [Rhizophagus irregularis DAOM 197198w]UZO19914.1 hypothetical protein OCT59_011179 [Rhizophagus irregularis]POG78201.1 hypothetical protein GLOIN_2v1837046 [Rhizophagus irregularis DAOM 181602=DAOM 197198]CAB4413704.1 unnamed protein product [Rhizophagus irregularis]CAB4489408.1 unnamed protein product [Rhizophagus irregularis]|eukprot:XP_025185067.1 hypothetical protein GLOIN_2v1837046 [Rhizophagus irregularis DAOM 181602=DAOM 197198]
MPKKISQKFSKKGKQPLFNSSQQKTSALKKVQNEKTPKSTNYKNTMKLNNTNSLFEDKVISSNSNDNENEELKFNKDESGDKDEDIIMQNVESTSSEEEDSSDNENMKKINYSEESEESEEENSNVENMDEKELSDKTDDEDDEMDEIVEDTTKISLKKKTKEKEEIKSQDKNTSKETTEEKDLIPTPLLARPQAEKQFRDFYMNQITKAFGEDLDKLRKKEVNLGSNKLEILIDALESGISIFSDVEKELALLSSNKK